MMLLGDFLQEREGFQLNTYQLITTEANGGVLTRPTLVSRSRFRFSSVIAMRRIQSVNVYHQLSVIVSYYLVIKI